MTRAYTYLVSLVVILFGIWIYGHTRYQAGQAKGNAQVAAIKAQDAAELAKQSQAARAREQAQELTTLAAESKMLQDFEHDKANQARVIAGIRSGAIKLRDEWAACRRLPKAGTNPAVPDGQADKRSADIAEILRIAADSDAQVKALQAVLLGERK